MRFLKRVTAVALVMATLTACGAAQDQTQAVEEPADKDYVTIELSDERVKVEGGAATENTEAAVYVANDIVYYEAGKDFTYGEGTEDDSHNAKEAAAHTVVHVTQPGTYSINGRLSKGQIAVDLGEDAEEDPNAVVTLILNGVDITCTVAPAVIFYSVYECGSADAETATKDVDTSAAGANVMIADGTANTVTGSYVARIYKPDSVELSEDGTEVEDAKKLHKYDAAFYSRMSMNVNGGEEGSGTLYIDAENEGLDSELHLTINGGNIHIESGNDGINTNEDGVSVTTINGGNLSIIVNGETGEGDGIDSNGWLVINRGSVVAAACDNSADAGIDSDMGIHINGGTVMATGHMLDRIEDGGQNYAVFSFAEKQKGGTEYTLKPEDGHMLASYVPSNDFSILLVSDASLTAGDYSLWQGEVETGILMVGRAGGMIGGPGMGGFRPGGEMPEGIEPPEGFEPGRMPEGMTPPAVFAPAQIPEGMEPPESKGGFEKIERNEDGTIIMPEGAVIDPETGIVTLSDGSTIQFDAIRRPDDVGSFHGNQGGESAGERTSIFTMTDGGAMFSRISPAE